VNNRKTVPLLCLALGLLSCVVSPGCAERADTRLEQTIDQAIRGFQPEWQPPKDQIQGLTVFIVPLARVIGRPDHEDRLGLITAGYYYHMVRMADGIPAMYRSDADLLPGTVLIDRADVARTAAAAKCDLCIILHPPPSRGTAAVYAPMVCAASSEPLSRPFAEAVAGSLASSIAPSDIIDGLRAPAIRIRPAGMDPPQDRFAPPPHRLTAEAIHKAVASFVADRRDSLIASRATRWPQTAPSAIDLGAVRPIRPEAEKIAAIARNLWPSGNPPPDQVAWYCSLVRRTSLTDNTTIYFDPQTSIEADTVVLRGATTVPAIALTLEKVLKQAGIHKIRNEMRSLPEDGRLDGRRFAVVTVSTVRTYSTPSELGNVQTQLLYGELLWLLDRRDDWYLAHAGDGYWGWVRQEAIRVIDETQFESSLNARQATALRTIDVEGLRIPAGARLPLVADTLWGRSLRMPTGNPATVPTRAVRVIDDFAVTRPRILPALRMLYVPYLFGARSPLGLDCSGMVNNLFDRSGLPIARDATQQFVSGKLVATRWHRSTIRPGDRLYFIDNYGKIFHTGIAITPTHFIHSSPPAVQISSLQKGDRLYEENWDRCFVAAKRP
jgi:gamma-D-glutamyl-L-lysine dipeptidyl-peptidase